MKKLLLPLIAIVAAVVLLIVGQHLKGTSKPTIPSPAPSATNTPPQANLPATTAAAQLTLPLDRAAERMTKKFYGTYVTPKNSPVSPERFTGYHTGQDFETFPEEKDTDVSVHAVCTGPLLLKKWVSGYGGTAVQKCTVNNQTVTVLYGHLRLSSITPKVGTQIKANDIIGLLGTGYSTETDGERKHLHLGIHIGSSINLKGYVQTKSALAGWLDPKPLLGL
jgi:murein DD-endopeptidase MepM/ murein hydrolase activator NlpD